MYKNYTPTASFVKAKDKAVSAVSAIKQALEVIFQNNKLLRGNVFPYRHKCGKPQCKCASSDYRHESWYLSFSDKGTNRLKYVGAERAPMLFPKCAEYKRFRTARQAVAESCRDLIRQINKIERIRTESLEKALKNAGKKGDKTDS